MSGDRTYETVIGLEVHAHLLTETKIFCGCENRFGAPPNSLVCPVCLGMPGVLPVLNEQAVELAIRAGLAFECTIHERSIFARKNYFYPDLPKGYQISQFEEPICEGGRVPLPDGSEVALIRIHLEEDAGKSFHPENGGDHSFVDLNRCGVPLIEIVSTPTIRSPDMAYDFLVSLKQILEFTGISDCNMEEGSLRCDANVSLRPAGEINLGTKTELKNLNSFRAVRDGLKVEIARQEKVLRSGGEIVQETLLWDAAAQKVVTMRTKEESHDYRYFPEPDLPPLILTAERLEAARSQLPELPVGMRIRFAEAYGLREYDAAVLTGSAELARFFEETVAHFPDPNQAANFVLGPFLRLMKEKNLGWADLPITPARLAGLLDLLAEGSISAASARNVLESMAATGRDAARLTESLGLTQISDDGAIRSVVREVLDGNAPQVAEYLAGKEKVFGFLVGQVMKATRGKGNPKVVTPIMKEELAGRAGKKRG